MNMEITSLRSYIDYELITVFSNNEDLKRYYINVLRRQSRSVRVAESRSRLKDKIKNLADKSNALNNENEEGNSREVSCQTTISIPPYDINNDEVLSSIGDAVDDLSLSSDDENYRNCVIKRISRKPSDHHLRQDMSYIDFDDRENSNKNISNLDNDNKDKQLTLFNRRDNVSTNFCEDVFVWEVSL